jgi:hypothetical protein
VNQYIYALNNPMLYVDPTGNMSFKTFWYISRGSQDYLGSSIKAAFTWSTYQQMWNLGKSMVNGEISAREVANGLGAAIGDNFMYLYVHADHIFNGNPTKDEAYAYGQKYGAALATIQGVEVSYYYHAVYSDGNYIFDPRYSSVPVKQGDYIKRIKNLNKGKIVMSS